MENKILSIDPSGTGTTGMFFKNGDREQFKQYTSQEWVEHYRFILNLVRIWQPNYLLFENSNYVSLRGKDMTSLWKLLGAVEVLPYEFPVYLQTKAIPVNQVKGLRNKLLKKTANYNWIRIPTRQRLTPPPKENIHSWIGCLFSVLIMRK